MLRYNNSISLDQRNSFTTCMPMGTRRNHLTPSSEDRAIEKYLRSLLPELRRGKGKYEFNYRELDSTVVYHKCIMKNPGEAEYFHYDPIITLNKNTGVIEISAEPLPGSNLYTIVEANLADPDLAQMLTKHIVFRDAFARNKFAVI